MAEENFQEEEISELFSYSRTLALPIPKEKQPDAPARKQQPRPNNGSNNRIMERNIKSQKKLEQVRTMLKAKEMQQCTFKPAINTKVQAKPRYGQEKCPPPEPQFRWDKENDINTRPSFRPKISEKSSKMLRQNPIGETLYEDALRRKHQRDMPTPEGDRQSLVSQRNNKIAGDKLVREYATVLREMVVDGSRLLNIHQLHEILKKMHFVRTGKPFDHHPENALAYEAYEILSARNEDGVRVKNLGAFLLALMGIFQENGQSHSTLDRSLREKDLNSGSMQSVSLSKFSGLIDQYGSIHIDREVGIKLHKYFRMLYLNRLSHTSNKSVTPNKSPSKSFASAAKGKKGRTQSTYCGKTSKPDGNAYYPHVASGEGGVYQWMTAEQSSEDEQKCTKEFEPSCFLEGGSKLLHSRDMKTFYTHVNESGSMVLDDSNVYQMTEPKRHKIKTVPDPVVEPEQPMFIMEIKIQEGLIDLPVYEHQKHSPGSIIDSFAKQYNLDSESRGKLYETLCQTLQHFGGD